jgi:hypothetical protein
MYRVPPRTAGDDVTFEPRDCCHTGFPVAASNAEMTPLKVVAYTTVLPSFAL